MHDPSDPFWEVRRLPQDMAHEAADALCDAFREYPVMRYVLDPDDVEYGDHLRTLVRFFVAARYLRQEPVLGIADRSRVVAVVIVTMPRDLPPPPEIADLREAVWLKLGREARTRYEHLGEAFSRFEIDAPHCHLNMIGVRRSHAGRGLARPLLEAVHHISRTDPVSTGVTLNTEAPENRTLYEYFGYLPLGHVVVAEGLETWGYFRPDSVDNS